MSECNYCPTTKCVNCGFHICKKAKDNVFEQLQTELATAKKQMVDYEQGEASVCPEDVGIKEYVPKLQAKLAEAKEEVKAGHSLWTEAQAGRKRLRLELDSANHGNKRLRDAMQKIIALYNRDKERGCFASSQDFQCGIRKGKKEAAVIAEQALKEPDKESDPQQYKPANKCITPGCGNLIDSNYCAKCREDWAS